MTLIKSWTLWNGPKIIIEKYFNNIIDLEEKSSDSWLISLYNMPANVANRLNFTIDMLVAFYLHA